MLIRLPLQIQLHQHQLHDIYVHFPIYGLLSKIYIFYNINHLYPKITQDIEQIGV